MRRSVVMAARLLIFVWAAVGATNVKAEVVSSGTAFRASASGYLLTNYHVVEGCQSLTVYSPPDLSADPHGYALGSTIKLLYGQEELSVRSEAVKVVKADRENDLALLFPERVGQQRAEKIRAGAKSWEMGGPSFAAYAKFRDGNHIDRNEGITVVGFPLPGLLAEIKITSGTVGSLSGLGGDKRHFQIEATTQGGNSGGPVLDDNGNVIGVVVAGLDILKVKEVTGRLPQNVNFAIHGAIAREFVKSFGVTPGPPSGERKDRVTIGREAVQYTFKIDCNK